MGPTWAKFCQLIYKFNHNSTQFYLIKLKLDYLQFGLSAKKYSDFCSLRCTKFCYLYVASFQDVQYNICYFMQIPKQSFKTKQSVGVIIYILVLCFTVFNITLWMIPLSTFKASR